MGDRVGHIASTNPLTGLGRRMHNENQVHPTGRKGRQDLREFYARRSHYPQLKTSSPNSSKFRCNFTPQTLLASGHYVPGDASSLQEDLTSEFALESRT